MLSSFYVRLTRVKKSDLEALFTAVELPENDTKTEEIDDFVVGNCYTINEVSEKFNANPSTISNAIDSPWPRPRREARSHWVTWSRALWALRTLR